jgi:glycosyltransferase 2 family protein
MFAIAPVASGESFRSFFHSVDQFFANFASVHFGSLLLALLAFTGYLVLRSRGLLNALRAAYPDTSIEWRRVWRRSASRTSCRRAERT